MKGTHAKYGGFAYSSTYAFSVPPGLFSLEQYALASQLGLSDDGGEYWKTRRTNDYAAIEYRENSPVLISVWAPFPDVKVKTVLVPPTEDFPHWHLRAHKIEAGRDLLTADGSFAIRNVNSNDGRYLDLYNPATCEGTFPAIVGNYDIVTPAGWAHGRSGAFAVSNGAVGIKALEKWDGRRANLVNADPNSNLMEGRTVIPTLHHTVLKGSTVSYISGVFAKPTGPKEGYLDGWERPPALPEWLEKEIV